MKKLLYITLALVLVLSVQVFASQVNNVELNYKDGFTVAVIHVDGAVRFTHQTEEAKNGKPFRVIVDILSSTHELGAKNFKELPNCPVTSIRTSQYSVSPEKIVRLVFDMDSEKVYRIDSDQNTVSLFFSDNTTKSFTSWSSKSTLNNQVVKKSKPTSAKPQAKIAVVKPEVEKKSATELNKTIDSDRMLSLSGSSSSKASPVVKSRNSSTSIDELGEPYGPEVDLALLNKEIEAQGKVDAEKKAQALAKAEIDKKAKAQKLAKAAAEKKAKQVKPSPVKKDVVVASAPSKKEATPTAKKPAPIKKTEKKAVAQKNDKVEKNVSKSKTSRFRRNPVSSKIKGTMVAQFPKRLVIKYKTKRMRDPFATLIDESKTYNNPVEKKVPNVEGLKLVGIIQAESKSDNRALFEDSDQYGYILKTGDKVRKGYVLRVDEDRVYFQIFEYGWSRTIALNLES